MIECNGDCLNCPYPDIPDACLNRPISYEEYRALETMEKDLLHPKSLKQKRVAAQQKAYREANRDKVAARQKARYEANRGSNKMTTTCEPKTNYRRGDTYAKQIAPYISAIQDSGQDFMLPPSQLALVRAMREDTTARERQCMELYYVHGLNYRKISSLLHINGTAISRNIQRGERKMNRILDLARAFMGQEV